MVIESSTIYFETPGEENTDMVLEIAKKRALERGIKHVVVASTRGNTGIKSAEVFQGTGINVVVVTHQTGHRGAGVQQLTEENKKKLEKMGVKIITGTDALTGGVGFGLTYRPPPEKPDEDTVKMIRTMRRFSRTQNIPPVPAIVASTLKLFCQGVKVAVEIVFMAADANVIPIDQDVVAIAGTGRGADTAVLIQPANTTNFPQMDVHEIIAKPFSNTRPRRRNV